MDKEPHKYADLVASDVPVEGPIEEDIPRTMYDHELFCRKSRVNGREMLRRVLTAYGRYDREVRVLLRVWITVTHIFVVGRAASGRKYAQGFSATCAIPGGYSQPVAVLETRYEFDVYWAIR